MADVRCRRSFLKAVLGAAAGSLCSPLRAAASEKRRLRRVGLQLYTVRRELEADFEGTLRRVAALGFREVEFAGYFGRAPREVRETLNRLGLSAPSAHVPLSDLRGDLGRTIEAARALGHRYLVCAWLPEEERRTLEDYRRLAQLFNRAGRRLRRAGLQFAYHNHDFEFTPLGGRVPYDLLLAETDARAVRLELDLYWIARAGRDPLPYFSQHPGRFPLLHLKDMDATPRRFFTELGRGVIDFPRILPAARRAGARHFFVEQDETPGPPLTSAAASLDYLKRLKF